MRSGLKVLIVFYCFAGRVRLVCAPIVSWHVFLPNAVQAHEHLASLWLDLAEGRLRLDRLDRNG